MWNIHIWNLHIYEIYMYIYEHIYVKCMYMRTYIIFKYIYPGTPGYKFTNGYYSILSIALIWNLSLPDLSYWHGIVNWENPV